MNLPIKTLEPYAFESQEQKDARMDWWRKARFGLFIHWGLYAIPAGEWNGSEGHGEWIRDTAKIPLQDYDKLIHEFNPVDFDAREWVKLAKNAGMKYIVFTTKHHDGFALYDSKVSDFNITASPYGKDALKELAEACREEEIVLCLYHSIMDWRHPDYLPRRPWETERAGERANMDRYVEYLHAQVTELLTNYGPIGVMWFDGEWENTWNHEYGQALYNLCRTLQPNVIVNNRVDAGRGGMAGMSDAGFAGDFGTPEQEIPATGLPGVDWESCMTMNTHWGYSRKDTNYKSTNELLKNLVDVASKGGNYLLNVGPTAAGAFPEESVTRLTEIGEWMRTYGETIYGTSASILEEIPWGRCTVKGSKLYLHLFDWPESGTLVLNGVYRDPTSARMLSGQRVPYSFDIPRLTIALPQHPSALRPSVVELTFSDSAH
jgi:alpha-L-fucosidase